MASPPEWLSKMVDQVTGCIHPVDVLAPLGCHFRLIDDVWEVSVFASLTEIVGGEQDGQRIVSPFFVDVEALRNVFSEITETAWQPIRMGRLDEAGPHLAIEGLHAGEKVWLRILADPPERFGVGRFADTGRTVLRDEW